nr:hypothetical protein [Acidovorax sp.]
MWRLVARRQGRRCVAQRACAGAAGVEACVTNPQVRHAHAQKIRPSAEDLPTLRPALHLAQEVGEGVG